MHTLSHIVWRLSDQPLHDTTLNMAAKRTDAFTTFLYSVLGVLLSFLLSVVGIACSLFKWHAQRYLYTAAISVLLPSAAILSWELYLCWQRSLLLSNLPGPPIPLLQGMAAIMQNRRDHHRLLTEWAEEYGPVYQSRFIMFHAVIVTDPVLARNALRSSKCDKLPFQYSMLDPFLGGTNLLTGQTDEHWRAVRKGVAPSFSHANMRVAFHDAAACCTSLADIMAEAEPETAQDMEHLLLTASMDIVGRVGFQQDLQNLARLAGSCAASTKAGQSAAALMLNCTHNVEANFHEPLWNMRIWRRDVRSSWTHFRQFHALVKSIYDKCSGAQSRDGSFAALLQQVKDPATGQRLSQGQILPEIAALFFAGSDTTAHTAAWTLYLISQHPAAEQKILAELQSLGLAAKPDSQQKPRALTHSDLGQLTYLQAVIKESMRLYPVVGAGQTKLVNEDLVLTLDITVPAGALLWVPHHAMHTSSLNWERSKEFVPERWLESGAEYAQKLPHAPSFYQNSVESGETFMAADDIDSEAFDAPRARRFFPFGEGPRNCVGQALAKMTLPTMLAILLSRFTFRLAPEMGGAEGVRAAEVTALVTGTSNGLYMIATPRK